MSIKYFERYFFNSTISTGDLKKISRNIYKKGIYDSNLEDILDNMNIAIVVRKNDEEVNDYFEVQIVGDGKIGFLPLSELDFLVLEYYEEDDKQNIKISWIEDKQRKIFGSKLKAYSVMRQMTKQMLSLFIYSLSLIYYKAILTINSGYIGLDVLSRDKDIVINVRGFLLDGISEKEFKENLGELLKDKNIRKNILKVIRGKRMVSSFDLIYNNLSNHVQVKNYVVIDLSDPSNSKVITIDSFYIPLNDIPYIINQIIKNENIKGISNKLYSLSFDLKKIIDEIYNEDIKNVA